MVRNIRTKQSLKSFILKNFNLVENDLKHVDSIVIDMEREIDDLGEPVSEYAIYDMFDSMLLTRLNDTQF